MKTLSELLIIAIGSAIVNNVVLSQFLGICPFLGVSKKVETATGMGGAVVFVITLSSLLTSLIYKFILLHGFFNYHYLMLKTLEMNGEKQQFLGIPGIYEQPERMMAMLFGFPEFEAAAAVSSDSKDMTGVFGYWMCPLNQD